jgi:hypothetical protein
MPLAHRRCRITSERRRQRGCCPSTQTAWQHQASVYSSLNTCKYRTWPSNPEGPDRLHHLHLLPRPTVLLIHQHAFQLNCAEAINLQLIDLVCIGLQRQRAREVAASLEPSTIVGWCLAYDSMECGAKRTRCAKTHIQGNLRDRRARISQ